MSRDLIIDRVALATIFLSVGIVIPESIIPAVIVTSLMGFDLLARRLGPAKVSGEP